MPRPIEPANLDDLIAQYRAGVSVKKLAEQAGVSRGALAARFARGGVAIRGRSEAERVKWSAMRARPEARALVERQCRAAWAAARGRVRPEAEIVKCATAMAGRVRAAGQKHVSDLALLLAARGVVCNIETAIGRYNVDLSHNPSRVAVEIQRQYPRTATSTRQCSLRSHRIEYLLRGGWNVLVVYCPRGTAGERIDHVSIAEKIVAFVQRAGRSPAGKRQYGVIDGYGKPAAVRRLDLDGWPRVEGF